jgi:hypothetical protein
MLFLLAFGQGGFARELIPFSEFINEPVYRIENNKDIILTFILKPNSFIVVGDYAVKTSVTKERTDVYIAFYFTLPSKNRNKNIDYNADGTITVKIESVKGLENKRLFLHYRDKDQTYLLQSCVPGDISQEI